MVSDTLRNSTMLVYISNKLIIQTPSNSSQEIHQVLLRFVYKAQYQLYR
jgi:hypothetical protein